MNDSEYQKAAMVTCSPKFHAEHLHVENFKEVLSEIIASLNRLDRIKKIVFYGKGINENITPFRDSESFAGLPLTETEQNIFHALVGSATEAGEKLEALYGFIDAMQTWDANGEASDVRPTFDIPNLIEEAGDGQWYDAILAESIGTTITEFKRVNIAKLKMRYKDKFDAHEANERNLQAERGLLEDYHTRIKMADNLNTKSDAQLGYQAPPWGQAKDQADPYPVQGPGEFDVAFINRLSQWNIRNPGEAPIRPNQSFTGSVFGKKGTEAAKHTLTLQSLIDMIEDCNFQCDAGPLQNNIAWRNLKRKILN